MVSVSGVRGVVGEGLTPDVVLSFAKAFGTYARGGKVVVARDTRVTGEMLKNSVLSGLNAVGCDVLDIGVCPTPTTQIAVETLQAEGGIMITASHNPIMWNGLKLIGADGLFLDAAESQEVLAITKGTYPYATWDKIGVTVLFTKAIEQHINAILALHYLDPEKIKERHFKVVLDCVCGAGANLLPELLHQFGCEVVPLNCDPTGLFPRNPEPVPENLTALCEAVTGHEADLGIAVDPDSDRLALVSEKGEPLGEERTLALATDFILRKKTGPVVINASTSLVTSDIANKHGAQLIRTQVGEIHVAKKMREVRAVIGGEGNGGVILPDLHLGRDAPVGVALILQHLADFGGTLSALNETMPAYFITKDKIELTNLEPKMALEKLKETYANERFDFTDGVKIVRNKSWIHVRPSNTEPIIRVIAEAPTVEESESLVRGVKDLYRDGQKKA